MAGTGVQLACWKEDLNKNSYTQQIQKSNNFIQRSNFKQNKWYLVVMSILSQAGNCTMSLILKNIKNTYIQNLDI